MCVGVGRGRVESRCIPWTSCPTTTSETGVPVKHRLARQCRSVGTGVSLQAVHALSTTLGIRSCSSWVGRWIIALSRRGANSFAAPCVFRPDPAPAGATSKYRHPHSLTVACIAFIALLSRSLSPPLPTCSADSRPCRHRRTTSCDNHTPRRHHRHIHYGCKQLPAPSHSCCVASYVFNSLGHPSTRPHHHRRPRTRRVEPRPRRPEQVTRPRPHDMVAGTAC